jgi:hypothetical protein
MRMIESGPGGIDRVGVGEGMPGATVSDGVRVAPSARSPNLARRLAQDGGPRWLPRHGCVAQLGRHSDGGNRLNRTSTEAGLGSSGGRDLRTMRLLVTAVVLAMTVGACASASGTSTDAVTTPNPESSASAGAPTVAPLPTSVSAPSLSPTVSASNAAVEAMFAFPDGLDMTLATPLAANQGHIYFPAPDGSSLLAGDWASGAIRTLVALPAGHQLAGLAATDDWLVYVDGWKDVQGTPQTPCMTNADAPLHWRILALALATGKTVGIDAGTSTRTTAFPGDEICPGPAAPSLAISGTVLAYDREDAVPGNPLRERVLARSLPDGTLVSDTETAGAVTALAALAAAHGSTPLVAWVEQPVTGPDRLLLSSPGKPDGGAVTTGVESIALSRDASGIGRLTWVTLASDLRTRSIWSFDLGAQPTRIDAGVHPAWTPLAARSGLVAWGQIATDTGQPVPLTVWDAATGRRTSVPTSVDPTRVWLTQDGWLAWVGEGLDAAGQIIQRGYVVTLAP